MTPARRHGSDGGGGEAAGSVHQSLSATTVVVLAAVEYFSTRPDGFPCHCTIEPTISPTLPL